MKSYQETITWLAEQTWAKWNRGVIGWKEAIGGDVTAIAFIHNLTPYEVSQQVWEEVIDTHGDMLNHKTGSGRDKDKKKKADMREFQQEVASTSESSLAFLKRAGLVTASGEPKQLIPD